MSPNWRDRIHEIIFEADTREGKLFDVALFWCIFASILIVMLESVSSIRLNYQPLLYGAEWLFTILFTVEYILRLLSVGRPLAYALSFYGLVDLLSILPTYVGLFYFEGAQSLLVIRTFRLLRVFRVFKLGRFVGEAQSLRQALHQSVPKISVFLGTVISVVLVVGTLMYLIEGRESGFSSIPRSMYWAVVTMTTVGYGDIAPRTAIGQFFAAILMILGYGILAVPTGIVSAELVRAKSPITTQACPNCGLEGHDPDAMHCKRCGNPLNPASPRGPGDKMRAVV